MNFFNRGSNNNNNNNNYAPPKVPVTTSHAPSQQYGQREDDPYPGPTTISSSAYPSSSQSSAMDFQQPPQQQQTRLTSQTQNLSSNDSFTSGVLMQSQLQQPQQMVYNSSSQNVMSNPDPFASDTMTMQSQAQQQQINFNSPSQSYFSSDPAIQPRQTTSFNVPTQNSMANHDPFALNTATSYTLPPASMSSDSFAPVSAAPQQQHESQDEYQKQHLKEEADEDRELRQAQEAALYAEEFLRKQNEEKTKQEGGFSAFGLLPKAQNFLQAKQKVRQQQSKAPSQIQKSPQSKKNYQENYGDSDNSTIQVDDVRYGNQQNGPEDEGQLPPWFAAKKTERGTTKEDEKNKPGRAAAVSGAALLGGAAGLIALGPITGVVAATAVAVQAAKGGDDGILRKSGRAVASGLGSAKRFEDKHGVGKAAASGLAKGVGWIVSQATTSGNTKE